MNYRSFASMAALAALSMGMLLAQAPAAKTAPAAKGWTMPRTPDGKPDLQGIWTNGTVTPLERPKNLGAKEFYTDEEYAKLMSRIKEEGEVGEEGELGAARRGNALRFDLELYGFDAKKTSFASNKRTSLIIGPDGHIPPMLQEAKDRNAARLAKNKGHEFDSYENRPYQERCVFMNFERIPMLPGANDNGNLLQIVQAPGYVTMFHEIDHNMRVIPTDGRPHVPQNVREWNGDSVGHWEGNTLVVDTTNFTDRFSFRGSSDKLHLIEKFTRTPDGLTYQFTVNDPATWDKPWTAEIPWRSVQGPIYEWACHEANGQEANILRGARVAEQEAAKK
jgi:hypothetical protein